MTITVPVTKEQKARLRYLAESRNVTVGSLIRSIVFDEQDETRVRVNEQREQVTGEISRSDFETVWDAVVQGGIPAIRRIEMEGTVVVVWDGDLPVSVTPVKRWARRRRPD